MYVYVFMYVYIHINTTQLACFTSTKVQILTQAEDMRSDPSPLAIINEDYKEGQLNPFPGPKNFGPDSPMSWVTPLFRKKKLCSQY
jgi:hypothetical protein